MMQRLVCCLVIFCLISSALGNGSNVHMIKSLWDSGDYSYAAIELRRIAADSESSETRARMYLLAAEAYRVAGESDKMRKMLDHCEDESLSDELAPVYLALRVDEAEMSQDWISSALWAEDFADKSAGRAIESSAFLRNGSIVRARKALDEEVDADKLAALDVYAAGRDKSPIVGGLLGMIPGMGYAYSGEWGNMIRSMILNGLFGWAMAETGQDGEWGLFAVCSFFELTWYSGSIYGGIDAAHRHNRDRMENTVRALRGDGSAREMVSPRIDLLRLNFDF